MGKSHADARGGRLFAGRRNPLSRADRRPLCWTGPEAAAGDDKRPARRSCRDFGGPERAAVGNARRRLLYPAITERKVTMRRHLLLALLVGLAAPAATRAAEAVTYSKQIAPLVFQHCAGCHHPGEVAPFSLLSYADVSKRARQIQEVTKRRYMPPWKTVEGHGQFVGERRLSAEQIELIGTWVEQGAVEGDA